MAVTITHAVSDYHLHLESMGYAPNTIALSGQVLGPLMKFVGYERSLQSVSDAHIANFMLEASKTRQASSMGTTHSRLAAFFKWCVNTGRIKAQQNPMMSRRAPKVIKKERVRVDVSKFPLMLDLAGQSSPRNRALVALGLFTLLRDRDISNLRVHDIDLAAGRIHVYVAKSRIEDSLVIPPILDRELRRWLVHYQEMMGQPLQGDWFLLPFFVRTSGRGERGRLTAAEITGYNPYKWMGVSGRFVRAILEQVGVPLHDEKGKATNEGTHTLRRSGARALYDVLVADGRADALRIVQTALHHSNIMQTQHYIGLNPDRETRDTIMRTLHYGFEDVPTIGGLSDGENHGDHEEHHHEVRQVREA